MIGSNAPVCIRLAVLAALAASMVCSAQQAGPAPITISTGSLQKGFLRLPYTVQLEGQGGVPPLRWQVTSGKLPPGLELSARGLLEGTPTATGEFRFEVTATDNGAPAFQRSKELTLRVVAPLEIKWDPAPAVVGRRIEGVIKVSNETGQDFDLTVIVLAVNDIGRATAIGYQHFTLEGGAIDFGIPFGENLPQGGYQVNADVVGEVEATNTIHRARLATPRLQVLQGP